MMLHSERRNETCKNISAVYIGWPKCASTWVYEYLRNRGDCVVPRTKSAHLFSSESEGVDSSVINKCRSDFAELLNRESLEDKSVIEIGHDYIFSERSLNEIKEYCPNAKILVGLRDPREWIISEYKYVKATGRFGMPFSKFIEPGAYATERAAFDKFLCSLLDVFDAESVTILLQEELRADPKSYVSKLCAALEIPYEDELWRGLGVVNVKQAPRSRALVKIAQLVVGFTDNYIGTSALTQRIRRGWLRKLLFKSDSSRSDTYSYSADLAPLAASFKNTSRWVENKFSVDTGLYWPSSKLSD